MKFPALSSLLDRRLPPGGQVYAVLRAHIVKGRFLPGTALSEKRLAEELGISRTPIREALIRLSEDGLVNIVPQSGTYVSPIDVAAVYDSQLIREALECATVFAAARNIQPAEAGELTAILEAQKRCLAASDHDGFIAADDRLHARLIDISGHKGVAKTVQGAKLHLDRVRYMAGEDSPHIRFVIGQHEEIIDRVVHHDGRGARRAMRVHLRLVFDKLDRLLWDRRVLFDDVPASRPAPRAAGRHATPDRRQRPGSAPPIAP
jgi:DNA-binding GntR family transcriptional regulator